jgi:hypothetical protein
LVPQVIAFWHISPGRGCTPPSTMGLTTPLGPPPPVELQATAAIVSNKKIRTARF